MIVLVDVGGLEDPHVLHGDGDLVAPHYGGGVLLAGSLSMRMQHGDLKMYHDSLMNHHGALSHECVTNLTMMSGCWRGSRCLLEGLQSELGFGSRDRCRVGGTHQRSRQALSPTLQIVVEFLGDASIGCALSQSRLRC